MPSIIVPLDTSETAERSLPLARSLARQLQARATLVSVIDVSTDLEDFVTTREFREDLARLEHDVRDYLTRIATSFGNAQVDIAIRHGTPVEEISRLTTEFDDPLLVIASHGRSGIRRHVLGSVAMRVIHEVECPVFVVTASSSGAVDPVEKLLVPLDGSDVSEQALETVNQVFGAGTVDLHVMRVAELGAWRTMPFATLAYSGDDGYYEAARETVTTYLDAVAARLRAEGYTVTSSARTGVVADAINRTAGDIEADIIAMGTHGRAGLGRLVMGSVAERVIRESTVPVLLQRPREP